MKKILKITSATLFVALLAGTFWFLWQKTRPQPVLYRLEEPRIDTLRQYVVATGKIEPRDEVAIKPQISGIISEVHKEAGQPIRKGDVIATVKVVPEMGQLSGAESRVTLARLSLDQLRREDTRTQSLYREGIVPREEAERSRMEYEKAEEELRNAQEGLEIVKEGIASRFAELSNTQIRSTIDGMILDVPIKVGNSVIQSNTFNDGTTIATVADMSEMIFRGNIDETDVGKLREGMPVRLTVGALQEVTLGAILEYVAPKSTEENGVVLFEVKAAVTVPSDLFVRAGYSANASIMVASHEGVLTVPERTVEFDNGQPYVYVCTNPTDSSEQIFERRDIEIGLSDGLLTEVTSGLRAGESIRGAEISPRQPDQVPHHPTSIR